MIKERKDYISELKNFKHYLAEHI